MSTKLPFLAVDKLPEHIRESYPQLVTFVQKYYEFLDTLETIRGNLDLDSAALKFVKLQNLSYARGFNTPQSLDVVEFVRNNKAFFAAKGNEQAFIFFFKAFFGEDITVVKPRYIIASGGKFSQKSFITFTTIFGSFIGQYVDFVIENTNGKFLFQSESIQNLGGNQFRVTFTAPRNFKISVGDKIAHRNADTDIIEYLGSIDLSPKALKITVPGKFWQIGQIVTVPGSSVNTIAKVTRVDNNKGIAYLDIIQFGYGHSVNQTLVTSPFNGRPAEPVYTITKTITSATPRAYLYSLNINDSTNGIDESIRGVINSQTVVAVDNIYEATPIIADTDFSLQDWLDSRATIQYTFDTVSKTHAEYIDEESLISNQSNRIHDNYYYQAFSYLIQTKQNIDTYRGALDIIHPAGLKFFAELTKIFDGDVNLAYEATRTMSIDKLFFNDFIPAPTDIIALDVSKPLSDTLNMSEALSKDIAKTGLADTATLSDGTLSVVSGGYAVSGYDTGSYSTFVVSITIS
jgi:hypothetical protein